MTTQDGPATRAPVSQPAPGSAGASLVSTRGTTTIADGVVTKIAGLATREVDGVHELGGGATRAIGALRDRIPGRSSNAAQGVSVEVTDLSAAIEVEIIVDYGVAIAALADGVRRNVISAVERLTGMTVSAVNVNVLDIHLGGEDADGVSS